MSFDGGYYGEIDRLRKQGKVEPVPQQVYTTAELEDLALADSPHMLFMWQGREGVIQNSHLTREQFLGVPGMADRRWKYIRTTHEWVPLFQYCDVRSINEVVDIKIVNDYRGEAEWWATPKGFPRDYRI